MYEANLGLTHRPFQNLCSLDAYFPTEASEAARKTLRRSIERGEGIGLLIGAVGTGKTLVNQLLAAELSNEFEAVLFASSHPHLSRRELLQTILFEVGLPYRGLSEGELRLSLTEYLTHTRSNWPGMLLLVDDAQHLPPMLLEELRLLSDLSALGQPRVRLVLAGTPRLEEVLADPHMESLNQRLAARCYLQPFTAAETRGYLAARIKAAGGKLDQVFAPEAVERIHRAAEGIPRLINLLSDAALVLAAQRGRAPANRALVDEAWSELQQFPGAWNQDPASPDPASPDAARPASPADRPSVFEFGPLSEPGAAPASATEGFGLEPASLDLLGSAPPFVERTRHEQPEITAKPVLATLPRAAVAVREPARIAPLEARFEEEELVVDPYARLDALRRDLILMESTSNLADAAFGSSRALPDLPTEADEGLWEDEFGAETFSIADLPCEDEPELPPASATISDSAHMSHAATAPDAATMPDADDGEHEPLPASSAWSAVARWEEEEVVNVGPPAPPLRRITMSLPLLHLNANGTPAPAAEPATVMLPAKLTAQDFDFDESDELSPAATVPPVAISSAPVHTSPVLTVPSLSKATTFAISTSEDEDVIIVEDSPAEAAARPLSVVPVQRQDFRLMFTRLLRGKNS